MKKISYNTRSREELQGDLAALRQTMQSLLTKSRDGKTTKEYGLTRKNIARALTALNAKKVPQQVTSTEVEK